MSTSLGRAGTAPTGRPAPTSLVAEALLAARAVALDGLLPFAHRAYAPVEGGWGCQTENREGVPEFMPLRGGGWWVAE